MEQRPLRLGDVVDDYCPRERRITNHAIVALVGEAIRQTRCTTCDSEHVYKNARVPRRRKKDETAALYDQVLADAGGAQLVPAHRDSAGDFADNDSMQADNDVDAVSDVQEAVSEGQEEDAREEAEERAGISADRDDTTELAAADGDAEPPSPDAPHELWPAHRRLIRATLPRTDNDPPAVRPIPEFTMHQRQYQRGGNPFRNGHGFGHGNGHGNGNGNTWQANGNANGNVAGPRHGGGRPGGRPGGDQPNGHGSGQPGHGGRKRHRGGRHRRPR